MLAFYRVLPVNIWLFDRSVFFKGGFSKFVSSRLVKIEVSWLSAFI